MIKNKIEKIFSDSFDIPLDSLLEIPNAQFIGNKHLHIDGCTGVKKYEKNNIVIKCKRHVLTIKGNDLSMLTFSNGRISVRGTILTFQIEEMQ